MGITHIASLKPDPTNARKRGLRAEAMLVKSLHEVGAARSIVIDEDGRILAGNGTVEAAAEAGIERVQVVDADGETIVAVRRSGLTEEQKRRLSILDNRTGELAEWNPDVLSDLLNEGLELGDLWDDKELETLLRGVQGQDGLLPGVDPDTIPEQVDTRCKCGDLWRLGDHRLLCGDSTEREDVERLMGGEHAGLCLTDPPYNIGFGYDGAYEGQDRKSPAEYGLWLNSALAHAESFARGGSCFFVWQAMLNLTYFSEWFAGREWRLFAACKNFIQARATWMQYAWDPVVCWTLGAREQVAHAGIRDWHVAETSNTQQTPDRVISGEHPCPRPLQTVAYLMDAQSVVHDLVYDPFLGSGTTLIAAEQLGRKCYGLEIEPKYCDVILTRWEQATGREAELIEHGTTEQAHA